MARCHDYRVDLNNPKWDISPVKRRATPRTKARTLPQRHLRLPDMRRIPVAGASAAIIRAPATGLNALVRKVIDEFCPRFTPGGIPIYVTGADKRLAYFDADYLDGVGVVVGEQGKMPDVVVHLTNKDWLFLIEAATSHGPVDENRRMELTSLFAVKRAGLVFVTAIPNRAAFSKCLANVAWGTHVWVANAPDHIIHFNGGRLLGPR